MKKQLTFEESLSGLIGVVTLAVPFGFFSFIGSISSAEGVQ